MMDAGIAILIVGFGYLILEYSLMRRIIKWVIISGGVIGVLIGAIYLALSTWHYYTATIEGRLDLALARPSDLLQLAGQIFAVLCVASAISGAYKMCTRPKEEKKIDASFAKRFFDANR
jgi:hypothetical protein